MQALASSITGFTLARRVITRSADAGGEDFEAATEDEFETLRAAGAFCLDWRAHGLRYGNPVLHRLRDAIAGQFQDQVFVIFDCPSSTGLLAMNALFAADELLIPVTGETETLNGALKTLLTLKRLEASLPRPVTVKILWPCRWISLIRIFLRISACWRTPICSS